MTAYAKERFFYIGLLILILLRQNFGGWDNIQPVLFGWIPYVMWYDLLLTIITFGFWIFVCGWIWPEPDPSIFNKEMNTNE